MGGDSFLSFLRWTLRIEKNQDGWARSTEGGAKNARLPRQFLQARKEGTERGAIRLMDAVFESGSKQFVPPLREGGEQQHGVLNVDYHVGAGILRWEHAPGFLRGKGLVREGKK